MTAGEHRLDAQFDRAVTAGRRAFGVSVQLSRGGTASSAFTAISFSEDFVSIEHETGLAVTLKRRVYTFDRADAVISAATVTPRKGDSIIDGADTMTILSSDGKPAVEEDGVDRWLVRTDKIA